MKLDLSIQLLDWLWRSRKSVTDMTLAEIKQENESPLPPFSRWLLLGNPLPMTQIIEREILGQQGSIPIRLYYPTADRPLPLIVFFHGGGWVTGSLETHDVICRQIAHRNQVLVASVAYRLAPWHPYPIPRQDCYNATLWLSQNAQELGATNQLVVMGDSAGGNLATVVCLMARDLEQPLIQNQVLIYPVLDGTLSSASHQKYPDAPFLNHQLMQFFVESYAQSPAEIEEDYFSPLLAKDLSHLPPALILTAEHDPLHDEGIAYAQRLWEAGIEVESRNYPGMIHAFLSFPRFCSATETAFTDITVYLQSQLRN